MAKPQKYPFIYKQEVSWGDMDAYGHVNNVTYVRYFENARAMFFSDKEMWETPQKPTMGGGPVMTSIHMNYRKQVIFPNTLDVSLKVTDLQSRGFIILCSMWDLAGVCVNEASSDFIWFDFLTGRPTKLPELFKIKFGNHEK
jgi:acyl-CoA thioester hydrolase